MFWYIRARAPTQTIYTMLERNQWRRYLREGSQDLPGIARACTALCVGWSTRDVGWSTGDGRLEHQEGVGVAGEGVGVPGMRGWSTMDGARRVTMFVKVHHEGPRRIFSNRYSTASHPYQVQQARWECRDSDSTGGHCQLHHITLMLTFWQGPG